MINLETLCFVLNSRLIPRSKTFTQPNFCIQQTGKYFKLPEYSKNHYNQNQSDCKLHEFIYNDKGDLLFFHYYSNENYPAAYSQNLRADVNQMDLFNSYAYSFDNKKGSL